MIGLKPKCSTIVISVAHDFDFASAIPDNVLGSMWNSANLSGLEL